MHWPRTYTHKHTSLVEHGQLPLHSVILDLRWVETSHTHLALRTRELALRIRGLGAPLVVQKSGHAVRLSSLVFRENFSLHVLKVKKSPRFMPVSVETG